MSPLMKVKKKNCYASKKDWLNVLQKEKDEKLLKGKTIKKE